MKRLRADVLDDRVQVDVRTSTEDDIEVEKYACMHACVHGMTCVLTLVSPRISTTVFDQYPMTRARQSNCIQ